MQIVSYEDNSMKYLNLFPGKLEDKNVSLFYGEKHLQFVGLLNLPRE